MPVEPEKVEMMLRAGMAAPSACNKQPWHFVVINDREILDQIPQFSPYASMVKQAPLAIVVCGCLDKTLEGTEQKFWIQDCSAATENILLMAHGLGLGGVWTALYPPERTIRGNAATAASAQDDDSAQHPHHRISEESGSSKG